MKPTQPSGIKRWTGAVLIACCLLATALPAGSEDDFSAGLAALKAGRYLKALSSFNRVLETDPDHAKAHNGRGTVWYELRAFERAIADYTRAVTLDPRYANAYNNRGVAHYMQGNFQQAIGDYNQALSIDPDYVNALGNRGAALKKMGRCGEAIADFNKAISLKPTFDAYNHLGWTLATCPDGNFRNGQAAVDAAKKAVAITAGVQSLGTLAAAYAEAGRFQEAAAAERRVIDILKEEGGIDEIEAHTARLELFQSGNPFREDNRDPVASTAPVPVENAPETVPPPGGPAARTSPPVFPYTVLVGSHRERHAAYRESLNLREKGVLAFNALASVPVNGDDRYDVFVGFFETADAAEQSAPTHEKLALKNVRVVEMPYAVQILPMGTDQTIGRIEQRLSQREYLPYRLTPPDDRSNLRLLIGAFASEEAAANQVEHLGEKDLSLRIVRR